jgi:CDP-diacylglycerol--glycerol-3-phosphate 3-phosphatidyltransferase
MNDHAVDESNRNAIQSWPYPGLAKPESDGIYCYHLQRRLSGWLSVRLAKHIGPKTATAIDMFFGVAASLLLILDHWLWSVVMIQAFGIFSCVDGEIARIQGRSSRIGDFLDTLTDRVTELLFVGALVYSLADKLDKSRVFGAGLALLGGIFLLTTSSEKFRSAYHVNYPKRKLEVLFGPFCSGSDSRLLMLSIGLVVASVTGHYELLLWLLWALAAATYTNFVVRVGLVHRHFRTADENPVEISRVANDR